MEELGNPKPKMRVLLSLRLHTSYLPGSLISHVRAGQQIYLQACVRAVGDLELWWDGWRGADVSSFLRTAARA